VTAREEREAAIAERDQVIAQNDRLQHLLHQLQRMQLGVERTFRRGYESW
jgi:hypothetical protein